MNAFVNPAIFGPNIWHTIDNIIAPLPEIIDNTVSESIRQFYISLKNLLPCKSCLTSYNTFLNEFDTNINNDENFKKRTTLILFNYTLRTKVNNKLGKYYVINLNYYTFKLNLYKCTPTNGYDVLMSQLKESSFIPDKYLNKCMEYVQKNKNLIKKYEHNFTITLIQKCKMFILNIKETDFNENNKMFLHWVNRNKKSYKYQSLLYDYQTKKNCDINNLFNEQPEIISNLLYWGGFPFSSYEIEKIDFLKNV